MTPDSLAILSIVGVATPDYHWSRCLTDLEHSNALTIAKEVVVLYRNNTEKVTIFSCPESLHLNQVIKNHQ